MAVINRFPQYADRPHFVYRAFDAADRLLYIGCTVNFEQRRRTHEQRSPWAHRVDRWDVERFDTQAPALLGEEAAIKAEHPEFNAMYNGAGLTGWNDERRAAETCLHGHPWEENARTNAQGMRVCHTCQKEAWRRHDRKRRNTRPSTIARDAEREQAS